MTPHPEHVNARTRAWRHPITTVDSADQARAELAKLYADPAVPVFARFSYGTRFGFEVGYLSHNGRHVEHVVVGRGASWVNALNNAERRIVKQRATRPPLSRAAIADRRMPYAGDLFPQQKLPGGSRK